MKVPACRIGTAEWALRVVVCVCAAVLGACEGDDPEPTPLMGGIESRATPTVVQDRLGVSVDKWRIIEDGSLPPGDKRPRFAVKTVSILGFEDRELKGELVLRFFNDGLASAWFYPDDFARYRSQLARVNVLPESEKEKVSGRTLIREGEDYQGRRYIAWEDRNLLNEQQRWLQKYS